MKKFLTISRPRFWVYVLGPFWLVTALAYPLIGHLIQILVLFVYFTFPANILIYGINDIYDTHTDLLNEKKKLYENTLETNDKRALLYVIFATNIPFWIYAIIFLPLISNIFLIFFILLSWQYSAPPIRAKAKPFFDSFFSGLLYIFPAGVSYATVYNRVPLFLPMLAGFLWSFAMHIYSAIPDINADQAADIQTSATILGKKNVLLICMLLYSVSAIIAFMYIGFFVLPAWLLYVYLLWLSHNKKNPEDVLSIYKIFPLVNTLVGGMLFVILFLQSQGITSF